MFKKTDKKYHIFDESFDLGFNGQGSNPLFEPVPNFLRRPGDHVIQPGIDNNTIIIFGRDRDPFRENKEGLKEKFASNPIDDQTVSGYSDHMGAGAIDIIVGRGAPYPVSGVKDYPSHLPPLYLTKTDNDLKNIMLRDGNMHPGYVMDAARIYISQMCDIDDYFAINDSYSPSLHFSPSSAIMLKADKVRMHSRRDIKIVAGGDKGTRSDSNGFRISERGSIHLIAGNGNYGDQQPIPVGFNLTQCLLDILGSIQSTLTLIDNLAEAQHEVNKALKRHKHFFGNGKTTRMLPTDEAYVENAVITYPQDMQQLLHEKTTNISSIINNYLTPAGSRYINSRYNTTT